MGGVVAAVSVFALGAGGTYSAWPTTEEQRAMLTFFAYDVTNLQKIDRKALRAERAKAAGKARSVLDGGGQVVFLAKKRPVYG